MNDNNSPIDTTTWPRAVEAVCEILVKLFGLYATYIFGSYIMESPEANNTLFSLLLLPALLVLKDAHILFEPFTIKAYLTEKEVIVKSGFFKRKVDKLSIETLENIELIRTPMGWLKSKYWPSYGTLNLCAYGGTVIMPFLEKPEAIQKDIEKILIGIKKEKLKISNNENEL